MNCTPKRGLGLALCLALSTACSEKSDSDDHNARPNVLLISIDTLRADHLDCYGYERETAPTLAQVAREGVLFEQAVSTTSWTLPSHLSMLTGLDISAHGICDDRLWQRETEPGKLAPIPFRGVFAPEVLAQDGYRTAGFYSWKYLDARFGFGPGFEVWERLGHFFYSHPTVGPEFNRLRDAGDIEGMKALAAKHPELFESERPTSPEVIDRATSWLDGVARQAKPWFLFVHLFDVHDPYTPPAPFHQKFDPDYTGSLQGTNVTAPDSPVRGDMDPRDLEHLVSLYDGEIAWTDSQVARLLAHLEALGVDDNTLVIITADHGEEFYEHGEKTHRRQLYSESVAVPLIMRWPAGLPAGVRVPETTGIVDIAPTIFAAADVTSQPDLLSGRELLSIARGERELEHRTYLTELTLFEGESPVPYRKLGLWHAGEHFLLRARGTDAWAIESFDTEKNRWEQGLGQRVVPESVESLAILRLLDKTRAATSAVREGSMQRESTSRPLSPAEIRELQELGYLNESELGFAQTDSVDEKRLCIDGCLWPDE